MITGNRIHFYLLFLAILPVWTGCSSDSAQEAATNLELQRRMADPEAVSFLLDAQKAYQQGAYRLALALTDSAKKLASELADIYFLRGQILTELNRYAPAQEVYRKVTTLAPGYKGVWFNLGNNEFRQGNYRKAINLYQKGLEVHPMARAYANLGRSYKQLSKVDSARWAFQQAIEQDSTYASAYMRLGQLYENGGKLEKALTYSRRGLALEPDNLDYQYIVGSQLFRTGRLEEAVGYLKTVVAGRPSHHGAHYNLGRALLRLGREEEAQKYLAEADSLEQVEAEIERLRSLTESNPKSFQAWINLGEALRNAGRLREALEVYQVARSIRPGSLLVQGVIANLYQAMGEVEKALTRYHALLRQDPTAVNAWFNLGVIYANAGQVEQARRSWENVLKYAPGHTQAKAYLARLSDRD